MIYLPLVDKAPDLQLTGRMSRVLRDAGGIANVKAMVPILYAQLRPIHEVMRQRHRSFYNVIKS